MPFTEYIEILIDHITPDTIYTEVDPWSREPRHSANLAAFDDFPQEKGVYWFESNISVSQQVAELIGDEIGAVYSNTSRVYYIGSSNNNLSVRLQTKLQGDYRKCFEYPTSFIYGRLGFYEDCNNNTTVKAFSTNNLDHPLDNCKWVEQFLIMAHFYKYGGALPFANSQFIRRGQKVAAFGFQETNIDHIRALIKLATEVGF